MWSQIRMTQKPRLSHIPSTVLRIIISSFKCDIQSEKREDRRERGKRESKEGKLKINLTLKSIKLAEKDYIKIIAGHEISLSCAKYYF